MPNKLSKGAVIGMAVITPAVVGILGAAVVGGVAALVTGGVFATAVTAAVWGASIFGGLTALMASFASGMADDSNSGTILVGGVLTTAALAFGLHSCKPAEPPAAPKTAYETTISAPFNALSAYKDAKGAVYTFAPAAKASAPALAA
jgi:hypothetical protein